MQPVFLMQSFPLPRINRFCSTVRASFSARLPRKRALSFCTNLFLRACVGDLRFTNSEVSGCSFFNARGVGFGYCMCRTSGLFDVLWGFLVAILELVFHVSCRVSPCSELPCLVHTHKPHYNQQTYVYIYIDR